MRLYQELRRRRVFRVAIAYVVGGGALAEAQSVLFPTRRPTGYRAFRLRTPEPGKIRFITAPDGTRLLGRHAA